MALTLCLSPSPLTLCLSLLPLTLCLSLLPLILCLSLLPLTLCSSLPPPTKVLGLRVQEWCRKWSWPLVWANSQLQDPHHPSPPISNHRVLDPVVLATAKVNASVTPEQLAEFQRLWHRAVEQRSSAQGLNDTVVRGWWHNLSSVFGGVVMQPLYAASCAEPDKCIGTTIIGDSCICKI